MPVAPDLVQRAGHGTMSAHRPFSRRVGAAGRLQRRRRRCFHDGLCSAHS
jgi:hypothetical protein